MMDAGIPVTSPIAGVAMGWVHHSFAHDDQLHNVYLVFS